MEAADRNHLVNRFLELARVDGVSRQEGRIRDRLLELLRGLGLQPAEDSSAQAHDGESGNLLCRVGNGGSTLLCAHMDTVQPTAALNPQLDEERIQSDGSTILGADDRAGIAAIVTALERVLREGVPDITLGFTVREELDGAGAEHLSFPGELEQAVIFDSSLRPGHIITQGFGAKKFQCQVKGRAAHAGFYPERGVNAIAIAARAIARFPFGRVDDELKINVGTLEGGLKTNIVAEHARFGGEVRALDAGRLDQTLRELREITEQAAEQEGGSIAWEERWSFKPYRHGADSNLIQMVEAAEKKVGLEITHATSAGGSDANTFNGRGLPSVNLGIGAQKPHSTAEFILIEDLVAASQVAEELMRHSMTKNSQTV